MTIKEAMKILQKEYNCRTNKDDVCSFSPECKMCKYYADSNTLKEALKVILDDFKHRTVHQNSNNCDSK